jgi:hypothetical protein
LFWKVTNVGGKKVKQIAMYIAIAHKSGFIKDNSEKLETWGTQNEENHNRNTTQYLLLLLWL